MSIKEQLKEAVVKLDNAPINEALSSIFESVELGGEVQQKFSTVFEGVIKAQAMQLAESYIDSCATEAEGIVAAHKQELNEASEEYGNYIAEQMEKKLDVYLNHITESWMENNRLAVEGGLKIQMFDNLVGGLKTMFVENNINVADDAVDVVKELEQEIVDLEAKLDESVTTIQAKDVQLKEFHKSQEIDKLVEGLADSQKEKVRNLAESLDYTEDFTARVGTLVEFATGGKFGKGALNEADDKKQDPDAESEGNPNFKPDDTDEDSEGKKKKEKDLTENQLSPEMAAYVHFSRQKR